MFVKSSKVLTQQGFTLIEVMVALMIFALVAVTASKASSGYLRTVDGMKTRTLASFVAQNVANDLKINDSWLTSSTQQTVEEQGRQWQVIMTAKPLNTTNNDLQSVDIQVNELLDDNQKTGTGTHMSIILNKPIS